MCACCKYVSGPAIEILFCFMDVLTHVCRSAHPNIRHVCMDGEYA